MNGGVATITPFADELSVARAATRNEKPSGWMDGAPMDPLAVSAEPQAPLPGFPFMHAGGGAALISGPTGAGRSSLIQACAYDAARAGLRVAYLGSEVTEPEFNARAADLAARRRDTVDQLLTDELARVRYINLPSAITQAWADPALWVEGVCSRLFDIVAMDPTSAVASALDLDFDKSNADFVRFYDRLVQPLVDRGVAVVLLENIGHATEARTRAKGASAKQDRADLTFSCVLKTQPAALIVTARKVRSVRAPFKRGDEWIFDRETQTIVRHDDGNDTDEPFKPTALMEKVSHAVQWEAGLSRNQIRSKVKGKATYIDQAIAILVDDGFIRVEPAGATNRHYPLKPYRVPESQPSPDRVPDPVEEPGPTESHPVGGDAGAGPGSTPTTETNRVPQIEELT